MKKLIITFTITISLWATASHRTHQTENRALTNTRTNISLSALAIELLNSDKISTEKAEKIINGSASSTEIESLTVFFTKTDSL